MDILKVYVTGDRNEKNHLQIFSISQKMCMDSSSFFQSLPSSQPQPSGFLLRPALSVKLKEQTDLLGANQFLIILNV